MALQRTTAFGGLAAASLLLACTGQNVEGRWTGRFPLEGSKECVMSLRSDHSATLQCDGTAIVGAGHYHWDGTMLSLDLPILTYQSRKVRRPDPLAFAVRGEGNLIRAEREGVVYEWRREMR